MIITQIVLNAIGINHMQSVRGDFLMTYDNDKYVADLARTHNFQTHAIAMKNTHHAEMTELLIGSDLSWLDQ